MKNLFRFTILFVLFLGVSACGSSQADSDPVAVLEALEAAHNAKDPDGVAALYAEDGYEVNGEGKFTGPEEIRELYARVVNVFTLDCNNYVVNGNNVTYECILTIDNIRAGERYEAVVENGKIKSNVLTETFTP
ncbi:MAG: nuclear transport factor 2 family protein [Chloroflexi bacterium]|nr:nuclear transport factor 2 family protein [Chloroflexota bacterium]